MTLLARQAQIITGALLGCALAYPLGLLIGAALR